MDRNPLVRLTGPSPARTLLWLIFLSLVVGFVLDTIGLDPFGFIGRLIGGFDRLVAHVMAMGSEAVHEILRYLVWGAVVVVPVWLVLRLSRTGAGPR